MISRSQPCPCGTGDAFGRCCLPLLHGETHAVSAEQLVRSRYSAYAAGDLNYVWRTWHPRTRPAEVSAAPGLRWVRLEIVDVVGGQPGDERGEVEFLAHYRGDARSGTPGSTLHERSRLAVRAQRWLYLDGVVGEVH